MSLAEAWVELRDSIRDYPADVFPQVDRKQWAHIRERQERALEAFEDHAQAFLDDGGED